jgi:dinuclear metal center YbgI/SA1388 family protein
VTTTEQSSQAKFGPDPIIFRPLKSITTDDWQQRLLLHLIQHNIAVYSPHSAVDAAADGLNDWLVDVVRGAETSSADKLSSRSVIKPVTGGPSHTSGVGYGRIAHFSSPVALNTLIRRIADGSGGLKHVLVALPRSPSAPSSTPLMAEMKVSSFAVCVGSGGSVLKDVDAELLVTGEMSHHEALRATMQGQTVVAVMHSNSERGFLRQRLQPMLKEELRKSLAGQSWADEVQVLVSEADAEPFEFVAIDKLD